jgi:transcriptional regulator with XRE-family HTH domain
MQCAIIEILWEGYLMSIRLRIKELIREKSAREGRTVTQKEVAAVAGVDQSMLSRYANGVSNSLRSEAIEKLLDYFGVDIGELMCRESDEPRPRFNWRKD